MYIRFRQVHSLFSALAGDFMSMTGTDDECVFAAITNEATARGRAHLI